MALCKVLRIALTTPCLMLSEKDFIDSFIVGSNIPFQMIVPGNVFPARPILTPTPYQFNLLGF